MHWQPVTGGATLVNGDLQVEDEPGAASRFYRVVEK